MNDPQGEEKKKSRLSNLVVSSMGLVRSGANLRNFHFIKSATGQPESQEESMSDNVEERLDAILEKLDSETAQFSEDETKTLKEMLEAYSTEAESFAGLSPEDQKAVRAFLASMGGKLGDRMTAMLKAMAGPSAPAPEESSEEPDKFAEMEKRLTERFTARLQEEQARTAAMEEKFAEEQRKRRLMEYTDQAATYSNLPVGTEQFGEDLMALADGVDAEVFSRITETLRAANKAVEQGELFSQFASRSRGNEDNLPAFEVKVRELKAEIIKANPLMDDNEAYTEAFTKAEERFPDLAREYGGA